MKRWSMISLGGFSEIEISHSTGISANSTTSTMAMLQRLYSRVPCLISASRSAFLDLDAEALDEDERDHQDEEEDQHRDRRAEAEVDPADQLVEGDSVFWAPRVMMKIESKTRNASRVRKRTATRIAGFISGRVIRTKRCQTLAPSTFAAS